MKNTRIKMVPYRRKREGRTNYKKRLNLLISGTPRLVVRKTNKHVVVQISTYSEDGDKVLVTVNSSHLKKLGWNFASGNLPAAYLTGLLAGKSALSKNINDAIIDLGLQTPTHGSRLFAAVKGAIDAGMNIPCSEEAFPSVERLNGKHIADYGKSKDASKISAIFDDIKSKIMKK